MKNDERCGANRGRGEAPRRSYGQERGGPRVGAIYSGVPAARHADAEGEGPAEYRGNGYGERREGGYARQNRGPDRARRAGDGGNFAGAPDRQRSGGNPREASASPRERRPREEEFSVPTAQGFASEPAVPPEENENLLAGRNPIREALKSGRSVEKLLVAKGDLSGAARDLIRMAKEAGAVVQEVDRSRLDAIYPAHQGLLAYVAAVDYASVDDLFARAEERGEEPFFVLLDGVTDPHNLGAILRTAECAGAHGAILPERRSAGLGPAAAKAAAGALDCLPVARVKNLNRTIDELKQRGVWIIGTAMEGEDALTADLTGPVALVIGSEGEGVSRLTLQKCDRTLTLPMRGRIESLNASVAAGILMYEVVRARVK